MPETFLRRTYEYCAKGGHTKSKDPSFVCHDHKGRGLYTHCAGCGRAWDHEPSRCYVCYDCLMTPVKESERDAARTGS